jgi:hypothetical protein
MSRTVIAILALIFAIASARAQDFSSETLPGARWFTLKGINTRKEVVSARSTSQGHLRAEFVQFQ